jgi:hypothetical protein
MSLWSVVFSFLFCLSGFAICSLLSAVDVIDFVPSTSLAAGVYTFLALAVLLTIISLIFVVKYRQVCLCYPDYFLKILSFSSLTLLVSASLAPCDQVFFLRLLLADLDRRSDWEPACHQCLLFQLKSGRSSVPSGGTFVSPFLNLIFCCHIWPFFCRSGRVTSALR